MKEMTTNDAAEQLGVDQSRVRALVASGAVQGRRVGPVWLVDADSVERQKEFVAAGATGRSMSARVAWAAGSVMDGGAAKWLAASERSRLRRRLGVVSSTDVMRRWLASRSGEAIRYQAGDRDVDEVLSAEQVVRTGVSAAGDYGIGLGTGGSADSYVSRAAAEKLIGDFYLIESRTGNLVLRVVDHDLHLRASRLVNGRRVAPRLIVGVDLADDRDARTRAAGRNLIRSVLDEHRSR